MKIRLKNGQVSIQFLIALGFIFILFIVLFVGFQIKNQEIKETDKNIYLRDFAYYLKEELNLALKVSDGYQRRIVIPEKINSMDFEISKKNEYLILKSEKDDFSIKLPAYEGEFKKGNNTLKKVSGVIMVIN